MSYKKDVWHIWVNLLNEFQINTDKRKLRESNSQVDETILLYIDSLISVRVDTELLFMSPLFKFYSLNYSHKNLNFYQGFCHKRKSEI